MASAYVAAGFKRQGSSLVWQAGELAHVVSLSAVRRLDGVVSLTQAIGPPEIATQRGPLSVQQIYLSGELASFGERYPRAWLLDAFDPSQALQQSLNVIGAFQQRTDLANFFTGRSAQHSACGYAPVGVQAEGARADGAHSAADTAQALHRLTQNLLGSGFQHAPSLGEHLWVSTQSVGSFHHGVRLLVDDFAVHGQPRWFSVNQIDLAGGPQADARLVRARQFGLRDGRHAALIKLVQSSSDLQAVQALMHEALTRNPPNVLPAI